MSKTKKCPYCGKRISYVSSFASRRKAEYVCPRCEKESKVVINKKVIPAFIVCAIISLAIMVLWIYLKLSGNLLGVLLVAIPLIIFAVISPRFVRFEPLKKYKKSMEAKKAGIAYSDNLMISEMDDEYSSGVSDNSGQFKINSDVFNQIRAERSAARAADERNAAESTSNVINSGVIRQYPETPSVRENHSGIEAPLKKLHADRSREARSRHYIEPVPEQTVEKVEDDVKEYKRQDGNRFSANRRF